MEKERGCLQAFMFFPNRTTASGPEKAPDKFSPASLSQSKNMTDMKKNCDRNCGPAALSFIIVSKIQIEPVDQSGL